MALNRELIGKNYEQFEAFDVTAAGASAYAAATNAEDIAAYAGEDAIAPPMYGVSFSFGALGAPILDGDLNVDMLRLVHGEQDMRFLRAVKPGSKIRSLSRIADIQEKSSGELLLVAIESFDEANERVLTCESSLFIRGPRQRGKDRASADQAARGGEDDAFAKAPVAFETSFEVAGDQSLRYAEASGDHNPIHTDTEAAKMAGLPGIILHGLCSMAFVHNALVRHVGGEPTKVERLKVRFSRPVLMGDTLRIDVRGPEAGPFALRVTNQRDEAVISGGLAELRG